MSTPMQRGLGYKHKPPSFAQRAASAARGFRVGSKFEPTQHPPFPELFTMFGALDQGPFNACTGFGLMAMLRLVRAVNEPTPELLSPILPYWAARRREVGTDARVEDNGAYVHDVEWAFNAFGSCPERAWPFLELPLNERLEVVNRRPPATAFQAALTQRSIHRLELKPIIDHGDRLLQRLAHSLHLGQVCCVAIPVDDRFMYGRRGEVQYGDGITLGNHFVTVLDWRRSQYDDSLEFLCGNSYGHGWGIKGTAWLAADLVKRAHYVGYLGRVDA